MSSRRWTRAIRSRTKRIVSSLFGVTENLPVLTIVFAANALFPIWPYFLQTRHIRLMRTGAAGIEFVLSTLYGRAWAPSDMAIIAEFGHPSLVPTDAETASLPDNLPRGESTMGSHSPPKGICRSYPFFRLVRMLSL